MAFRVAKALAFASAAAVATASQDSGASTAPVQKVLKLLEGLLEKGKEQKHQERMQWARYKTFCEISTQPKAEAVDEADDQIDVLKAGIEKSIADAALLATEIKVHDEDTSIWQGDKEAATKVRKLEKSQYEKTHQDYSESIDSLTRAIAVLKAQSADTKQGKESLVQLTELAKSLIPKEAKRTIEAFLAQDPDSGLAVSAPEAAGYSFQAQGVIEMLQGLQDKFLNERDTLEKEEHANKLAYEQLEHELSLQTEAATRAREKKSASRSKQLQAKADMTGDLIDTKSTRDADEKFLTDLKATCEQKAGEFISRQELRQEEIDSIEKAIDIISSKAVKGTAEKHTPQLLQKKAGTVLAGLRADSQNRDQVRAALFLKDKARELGSRVLEKIAEHLAGDPFRKVKKMIKDLLERLMQEANEEANHKAWCDAELGVNQHTRQEKTQAVETLHAEIDQLEASLTKLADDIGDLDKALAELAKAVAEATEVRQKEKAENEKAIKDAQAAQAAVAQALAVLNEFYAKAGEATALVQRRRQSQEPEIWDAPYKGMQGESGGVIGLMEVIEHDFARLETDTTAEEASAQKEYQNFMTDSKIDKDAKTKALDYKSAKNQDETQALTVRKSDLEGNQKELDAAMDYYDKLKPSCIDPGSNFEDRGARRKSEIESLKEALRILNGEDTV